MIYVENLTKKYGKKVALNDINFMIQGSQILVLVGPNGAGKSTLIKCLLGQGQYQGVVEINEMMPFNNEVKKIIGYVSETPQVFDYLTVSQHMQFVEKAYKLNITAEEKEDLLKRYHMYEASNELASKLSKGMKQKLNIICALMIHPEILILDEPFVGLDPQAIYTLKEDIKALRKQERIVFISTHLIEMVEELWDELYILNHGNIIEKYNKEKEGEVNIIERYMALVQ